MSRHLDKSAGNAAEEALRKLFEERLLPGVEPRGSHDRAQHYAWALVSQPRKTIAATVV